CPMCLSIPPRSTLFPYTTLFRSFGNALRPALRKAGRLSATDDARRPRLHVCMLGGDHLVLATAVPADSSPWPMGVPRLRLHRDEIGKHTSELQSRENLVCRLLLE